ncbi:MAG TPA: serine/threonine-protein kinase [Streptosporangiaceae bacterium]|nr:serine/threonine-protein kinase [Streptosporangiaceae bacterium]
MNRTNEPLASDTLVGARTGMPLPDVDGDEVTSPVTIPEVAGVRLLEAIPGGGPLAVVPGIRAIDDLPVWLILVTAELDSRARRRIRSQCADLERVLAVLGDALVVPLVDHGTDTAGRPFLVAARPGRTMDELLAAEGRRPAGEVPIAARAYAAGLDALAAHGFVGSPPDLCRTDSGAMVLSTPLPPALMELVTTLGEGTGHEPPEVLGGADWTPSGQVYACASMLWTLLAGRPPYGGGRRQLDRVLGAPPSSPGRTDVPDRLIAVLRSALAADPGARPADPAALAARLTEPEPSGHATMPPIRPAAAPRPLGSRYLLEHRIGQGASGHVWIARRREDDAPVAVKLLRGELSEDPDVVTRFMRERTVLRGLRHPHLVRVHDLVAEGDVLGIVMDLVDGEDLRRVAARTRLTEPGAATLLAQTASALAAVHAAGIVHRDVKPENILVSERAGRRIALLSDFGIARAIEGSAHTQLVGTPTYCAPELAAGHPPAPPVDVYALGVTGYELLAGRPPFTARTTEALLRAHLEQRPARPDGIADDTWALLESCLAKDPAARPSAAAAARRWAALGDIELPRLDDDLARTADGRRPLTGASVRESSGPGSSAPGSSGPESPDARSAGTELSARPLPVRPPDESRTRGRRLRLPHLVAIAVAVVLGAASGVGIALLRHDQDVPANLSAKPARPAPAPALVQYYLPASVVVSGSGSATISWGRRAETIPGFAGYIVYEVIGGRRAIRTPTALESGRTSFTVPPSTGRSMCYQVAALVTAAPPGPQAEPACVSPGGAPSPHAAPYGTPRS